MASKIRLGPSLARTMREIERHSEQIVKPQLTRYMSQHEEPVYDPWVVNRVTERLVKGPESRTERFGASGAGGCPRAQVLAYLGAPGYAPDKSLQAIFEDGKWRHMKLQALLLQAGIIDDIEVWSRWPRKRAGGQVDGYGQVPVDHPNLDFRGKDFGLEIKGASTWPYRRAEKEGPAALLGGKYTKQVARYFLYTGYDLFVFLIENKDSQELLEWVVTDQDVDMPEQEAELDDLNQAVDDELLPPMLLDCSKGKGRDFRDCPYGKSTENTCHQVGDWIQT